MMTSNYFLGEEHSFSTGGRCARSLSARWHMPPSKGGSFFIEEKHSSEPGGKSEKLIGLSATDAVLVRDAINEFLRSDA